MVINLREAIDLPGLKPRRLDKDFVSIDAKLIIFLEPGEPVHISDLGEKLLVRQQRPLVQLVLASRLTNRREKPISLVDVSEL